MSHTRVSKCIFNDAKFYTQSYLNDTKDTPSMASASFSNFTAAVTWAIHSLIHVQVQRISGWLNWIFEK